MKKKRVNLSSDIAAWIAQRVKDANAKGIVLGLSGGVDSSCVAVLSKMAVGKNVLGVIMPCQSSPDDETCAYLVAEKFNIKIERIPLDALYDAFVNLLPNGKKKLMIANLKPRLRMITLYSFANKLNYLVAGTGNKSELFVGYFTKYGDGGADLFPLGGLLKTEVRTLARELEIPDEIITRTPSAGLWEGQTDEGELGISYDDLDRAIIAIESHRTKGIPKQSIKKVLHLHKTSQHKRFPAPVYKDVKKKHKNK